MASKYAGENSGIRWGGVQFKVGKLVNRGLFRGVETYATRRRFSATCRLRAAKAALASTAHP